MADENTDIIIETVDLTKEYKVQDSVVKALRGVDLKIFSNEFVVIFGPSGCGKSTLLNVILGIDRPTSGTIKLAGKDLYRYTEDSRGAFRARKIGMVHQLPYWVKSLNVLENVAMPLIIRGLNQKSSLERAGKVMDDIGISDLKDHLPTQLSGGQQQKVGVARAIVSNPWIVMADEPTGNLDSRGAAEIIRILTSLHKVQKRTILLVTHNEEYWGIGTRRIEMRDGKIVKDNNHG